MRTRSCCGQVLYLPSLRYYVHPNTSPTTKTFDPDITALRSDLYRGTDFYAINIKSSKTDPFRRGVVLKVYKNGSELCPVIALDKYLAMSWENRSISNNTPLFRFYSGKYLTRRDVSIALRRFSGGTENISSHSLRIGGATTLASLGQPSWLIQSMGRWSSDCYKDYLRLSDDVVKSASKAMAEQPGCIRLFDPDFSAILHTNEWRWRGGRQLRI